MRPLSFIPVTVLAAAITFSGCAKQESTSAVATADSPTASAAPGSSAPPATSAPEADPNAKFIADADAICAAANAKLKALDEPTSDQGFIDYFTAAMPGVKQQVEDLEKLGAPPADGDVWEAGFGAQKKFATRLEELLETPGIDADTLLNDSELEAFQEEGKAGAAKFGLKVCGKSVSSGSSTGGSSANGGGSTTSTTRSGGGLGGKTNGGSSGQSTTTSKKPAPSGGGSGTGSGSVFDADTCLTLATANLSLVLATTATEAEEAAQELLALTPPTEVKVAIEILVDGPGLQIDDNGRTSAASEVIDSWSDSVCS